MIAASVADRKELETVSGRAEMELLDLQDVKEIQVKLDFAIEW